MVQARIGSTARAILGVLLPARIVITLQRHAVKSVGCAKGKSIKQDSLFHRSNLPRYPAKRAKGEGRVGEGDLALQWESAMVTDRSAL